MSGPEASKTWRWWAAAMVVLASACSPTLGCEESRFLLAAESRLPRWFSGDQLAHRSEFSLQMIAYSSAVPGTGSRKAEFLLMDSNGKRLQRVVGDFRGIRPYKLDERAPRPVYEVVTVAGVSELVEFRKREPVFHISDDQQLFEQIMRSDVQLTPPPRSDVNPK